MSDTVIKVEHLSKRYRIGTREAGYRTFRETLMDAARAPFDRMRKTVDKLLRTESRRDEPRRSADDTIWALKDISFEVKQGEVVGIIGRNGAGKSTLLKILSKITEPTEGRVELKGRVGSLLEVGTGFHPELTGHENVYLYGAILGMDRWEVTRKFQEIVAFAELERFIDTPVKRYSSGMYMRLAFAVAAHLEPEILLVDEVLAVGDLAFQRKCLGKMEEVSTEGRTILFVSHNMGAVRSLCTKAVLIDSGIIQRYGDVYDVTLEYECDEITNMTSVWVNSNDEEKEEIAFLERVEILSRNLEIRNTFTSSETIIVKFTLHINKTHPDIKVGFDLMKRGDVVLRSQQVDSPEEIETLSEGIHHLFCEIPADLLNGGEYSLVPLLSIHLIRELMKDNRPVLKFKIVLDTSKSPFHFVLNEKNHPGAVFLFLKWTAK